MQIVHPDLPGQAAEVTDEQFQDVYAALGWAAAEELPDTSGRTVKAVLAEVGDDPVKAQAALAAEAAGAGRVTLLEPLQRIAATPGPQTDVTYNQGTAQNQES